MFNDLITYDFCEFDNQPSIGQFYRKYINGDIVGYHSILGELIQIPESAFLCTLVVLDNSPDLIPNWLL